MSQTTKSEIKNYLSKYTHTINYQDMNCFSTSSISLSLSISRSLASHYLNELVKDQKVIKINSRPVYFLDREEIEKENAIKLKQLEFDSLSELQEMLQDRTHEHKAEIIGKNGSLQSTIETISTSLLYPPKGLPTLIIGDKGTGKTTLIDYVIHHLRKYHDITEMIIKFDMKNSEHESLLFGTIPNQHLFQKQKHTVIVVENVESISQKHCRKLLDLFTKGIMINDGSCYYGHIPKLIFTTTHPQLLTDNQLLHQLIPMQIKIDNFHEKPKVERTEIIIGTFKEEAQKIKKNIYLSKIVLSALQESRFETNLTELKNVIQKMVALEFSKQLDADRIKISWNHLPEEILSKIEINLRKNNENQYIDILNHHTNGEMDRLIQKLNYLFEKPFDGQYHLDELIVNMNLIIEYLLYDVKITDYQYQSFEKMLANTLDSILKIQYVNLPANLMFVMSRLYFLLDQNKATIDQWHEQESNNIDELLIYLEERCIHELYIKDNIIRMLEQTLDIETHKIIQIIMVLALREYNKQMKEKRIIGIILSHGYARANSIADAANSLLQTYMFDAIDMPLTVSVDDISDAVTRHIARLNSQADIVILVDMGSLEDIGEKISNLGNRKIGVINSVSTRLALDIGNKIKQGLELDELLELSSQNSIASYKIFKPNVKKDIILFTSESGKNIAERFKEIFKKSVPKEIEVDYLVIDYQTLVCDGLSNSIFKNYNVLFISGTSNPGIEGIQYIAIEDVIVSSNIESIAYGLSNHMNKEELEYTMQNLQKNFTLGNVVRYITILNPEVLLDAVEQSIRNLERKLEINFSGKTVMGLCVHISCLIERLIRKTAIQDQKDLNYFIENEPIFIQSVNKSFEEMTDHYNVELPISEIVYLHEYIMEDHRMEKREYLYDWIEEG